MSLLPRTLAVLVLVTAPMAARADSAPADPPAAEPAPAAAPAPVIAPASEVEKKAEAPAPAGEPEKKSGEAAASPAENDDANDALPAKKRGRRPAPAAAPTPGGLGGTHDHGFFNFDLSLYDSGSLNLPNYNNAAMAYLEPSYGLGKQFLKGTPFETLRIVGRLILTRTLAGYDAAAVEPTSDLGYAPRCSSLTTSANGTIDPNAVRRCSSSADYRITPGDLWLTVANPRIYTIPRAQIQLNPSVRFVVPLSYESRFATLRLATAAFLNLNRTFEDLGLTVSAAFGATKYFHKSTSPQVDGEPSPLDEGPVTAQYRHTQLAGSSAGFYADLSRLGAGRLNPSFALQQFVSADWSATEKLSFSVLYMWFHTFSYDSSQCTVKVAGQDFDACAAADRVAKTSNGVGTSPGRAVSDLQIFWAMAAYQVLPWISLQLSWTNTAPQRKEDNSFRQGFISTDYNAFTSVSVGATFSLSRIGEQ